MRFLLKATALPFVLVLSVFLALFAFLYSLSAWVFTAAATIIGLSGLGLLITGNTSGGIGCIVIGFLVSPFGLLAIVDWLVEKLGDLNASLCGFIMS